MREVVATRTRIGAAIMLIVAVAGAIPVAVLSLVLLPFGLYQRMSLNHSSRPMVRTQQSNAERRSGTEAMTNTVMHHRV